MLQLSSAPPVVLPSTRGPQQLLSTLKLMQNRAETLSIPPLRPAVPCSSHSVPEQKAARKAAAAQARTLCKLVWRHVSDAERRPIRNQQNPYADKKLPARCTPNGPARAADDESRCPTRPVRQRTQPHAPRAYRVTQRRTETGGSPKDPSPRAPKRPVAELQAHAPQDKTVVAQKTGDQWQRRTHHKVQRPR